MLEEPLPGPSADMVMGPRLSARAARAKGCQEAASLVLLYPVDREVHTVLTVRSAALRRHPGQVALPGGRLEPGETIVEAALREAMEELGVALPEVRALGMLSPVYVPPSDFLVTPVLAVASRRPAFALASPEVARIVEVDMEWLVRPEARAVEQRELRGELRDVPHYLVHGEKVWGATALVMSELVTLWRAIAAAS